MIIIKLKKINITKIITIIILTHSKNIKKNQNIKILKIMKLKYS